MIPICPLCHMAGTRVVMNGTFLRNEERILEVPGDIYPDGTVITQTPRLGEAAVFEFECPGCGLVVEWTNPVEAVEVPATP